LLEDLANGGGEGQAALDESLLDARLGCWTDVGKNPSAVLTRDEGAHQISNVHRIRFTILREGLAVSRKGLDVARFGELWLVCHVAMENETAQELPHSFVPDLVVEDKVECSDAMIF
jgi:hypothetical protein